MKGINPEWAKLPRRRCDDCNTMYKPKKPLRDGERGFCTANCRKSYHKHGGAYRKLKTEIQKLLERTRLTTEERCLKCRGTGKVNSGKWRGMACPQCIEGKVLTPYGREILSLAARRLRPLQDGSGDVYLTFRDMVNP